MFKVEQKYYLCVFKSVAHNRATVLGDHDINAMTTAGELVGQDLAAQESLATTVKTRCDTGATSGNACRHSVRAAGARIFDAPLDTDRRRWAGANRSWLAAYRSRLTATLSPVVEEAGVSRGGSSNEKLVAASGRGRSSRTTAISRATPFMAAAALEPGYPRARSQR